MPAFERPRHEGPNRWEKASGIPVIGKESSWGESLRVLGIEGVLRNGIRRDAKLQFGGCFQPVIQKFIHRDLYPLHTATQISFVQPPC